MLGVKSHQVAPKLPDRDQEDATNGEQVSIINGEQVSIQTLDINGGDGEENDRINGQVKSAGKDDLRSTGLSSKHINGFLALEEESVGISTFKISQVDTKQENGYVEVVTGGDTGGGSAPGEVQEHPQGYEPSDSDTHASSYDSHKIKLKFDVRTIEEVRASVKSSVYLTLLDSKSTGIDLTDCQGIYPFQLKVINGAYDVDFSIKAISPSRLKVTFCPVVAGSCTFLMTYNSLCWEESVEVKSNNPTLHLTYHNEYPTDVHINRSNFVFVTFMHHVVKYTSAGIFLRELLSDYDIFFNYLSVSDGDGRIVTGVTRWRREQENSFRLQQVRLYDRHGVSLLAFSPILLSPFVTVSLTPDNAILLLTDGSLDYYNPDGSLRHQSYLETSVGPASKFCVDSKGRIVVADSLDKNVKIFQNDGKLVRKFFAAENVEDSDDLGAISDVATDCHGNILVSERFSHKVSVYSEEGDCLGVIGSEGAPLLWPSGLAVSHDGHVFVADHGNQRVNKYQYR